MPSGQHGGTVLIAGATGFIGRQLVDVLRAQKMSICVLARNMTKVSSLWPPGDVVAHSGDIADAETLKDACAGVHTVFHLVSCSEEAPPGDSEDPHWRVTVEGTRNLLEAAARSGVKRFVYVSSVKAMGEGSDSCLDESSLVAPVSPYGRAKREAERLVLEAGKQHGMLVCNLRLPLVYGHDNRGNIWRMIAAIDRGRFPPLPETGNQRSMVHVDDVIQAMRLAAENPAASGQTYIVTDGRVYSSHDIFTAICKALGRSTPRWTIPIGLLQAMARMGDVIGKIRGRAFIFDSGVLQKLTGSACYSGEKIKTQLGYRPARFLEDGLREMVEEYKRIRNP
ncbi:MAG: NAD-dependent epimerase/dehydratase family protein [Sulfuricaulis sp.]